MMGNGVTGKSGCHSYEDEEDVLDRELPPLAPAVTEQISDNYNMSGRKFLYIFNQNEDEEDVLDRELPPLAPAVSEQISENYNMSGRKFLYIFNQNEDEEDVLDRELPPLAPAVSEQISHYYNTSGRKLLYIFNHYAFTANFQPRSGTESDVQRLLNTFNRPDRFEVQVYHECRYLAIKNAISTICNADHSGTACVAIAVLTHGETGDNVWAQDRPYQLKHVVIDPLLRATGLAGKPKLFFVQACRGENIDSGLKVELDGGKAAVTIPTHSDCLIVRSSFEDHVSFRTSQGSWMIQTLCDVMDANYDQRHLLDIMVLLNNEMAKKSSEAYDPEYHDKRQICDVQFTFTKFLKF